MEGRAGHLDGEWGAAVSLPNSPVSKTDETNLMEPDLVGRKGLEKSEQESLIFCITAVKELTWIVEEIGQKNHSNAEKQKVLPRYLATFDLISK